LKQECAVKVFNYRGVPEPYARFGIRKEDQKLWHDEFHGESHAAGWTPIKLHPAELYRGVPLPLGPIADVTTVDAVMKNCVWGPRTRAVLEPHVSPFGEFLALECKEAPWVLFNVTHTIDALDEKNSKLSYFKSAPGKVMTIHEPVFKPDKLRGELIFRIPQRGASDIFVTDAFARLVEQHGLQGFNLKPVWSDEQPATQAA
jgi:hypothetical protein